jgi:dCMP deaminase
MSKTHSYYMGIAIAVRKNANCLGRKVGAVLVKENRIVATGYNGTPEGVPNCVDGGCVRCRKRDHYRSSAGYDVCICVHAEQNAVITAARFGISVEGATAYTTMRPCFDCTKTLLQAKIRGIVYLHNWTHPDPDLADQYELLQARFPEKVQQFTMPDPDFEWANAIPAPPPSPLQGRKPSRTGIRTGLHTALPPEPESPESPESLQPAQARRRPKRSQPKTSRPQPRKTGPTRKKP